MFRFISRNILTGIVTILPVVLTLYLLYWLAVSVESLLGGMMQLMLPEGLYWTGMGFLAGLVVVFVLGLLMHAYVVQRLFTRSEQFLYHVPVIKTVYRAIRDFFDYFSPDTKKDFEQVVRVTIGNNRHAVDRLCHSGAAGTYARGLCRRSQYSGLSAHELYDWRLCGINAARDGTAVGYQHGRGGAFYADRWCGRTKHKPFLFAHTSNMINHSGSLTTYIQAQKAHSHRFCGPN